MEISTSPGTASTPYFCIPLAGKPKTCIMFAPCSSRPRTVQAGYKVNDLPGYLAFNLIRIRYGEGSHKRFPHERKFEKSVSDFRKRHRAHSRETAHTISIAEKIFDHLDCDRVTRIMATCLNLEKIPGKHLTDIIGLVVRFSSQKRVNDLSEFINQIFVAASLESIETYFRSIDLDPEETANRFLVEIGEKPSFSTLSSELRLGILSSIFFKTLIKGYNLHTSSWHPSHPISSLEVELREHGPHLIRGVFGPRSYRFPSLKLKESFERDAKPLKIAKRFVYYWPKGSPRIEDPSLISGCFVIVGVDVKEGRVYYLNPDEGSDPRKVEKQRIYAMSYERLQASISDITTGVPYPKIAEPEAGIPPLSLPELTFALHGDYPLSSR